MTGRAGDGGPAEDFADVADAAPPLDLLLSDAALGIMRRFRPDGSTARFGLGLARRPWTVTRRSLGLAGELGKIAIGRSAVAPAPRDRRFADPAWMGNPFLKRILQAYLAGGRLAESLLPTRTWAGATASASGSSCTTSSTRRRPATTRC